MFTGIITDIGEVRHREERGDLRFRIATSYDTETIDLGASIACNGVCLTAVALGDDWFDVDVSAETVNMTNIHQSGLKPCTELNLELSLKVGY